ncbi:KTSC domain-containing protein [Cupriavidus sp. H19C3]|uniref:KTSC domain-containing protein n=1 Tax=Cupriavidus sp. H19C3 TaxID=3241603 RepID=UPI003BF8564E
METTAVPSIALQEVDSSQIHSIGYDAASQTLAIRFRDRKTDQPTSLYHYSNFTAEDFAAFEQAESKGSHFGKHIKPYDKKYPYAKVEAKPAEPTAA